MSDNKDFTMIIFNDYESPKVSTSVIKYIPKSHQVNHPTNQSVPKKFLHKKLNWMIYFIVKLWFYIFEMLLSRAFALQLSCQIVNEVMRVKVFCILFWTSRSFALKNHLTSFIACRDFLALLIAFVSKYFDWRASNAKGIKSQLIC